MKILHLIHSLRRGGAERILLELSLGLKNLCHEVKVIGLLDVNEYKEEPYNSIQFTPLLSPQGYRWPHCIPRLTRALKKIVIPWRPDVIEIHTPTAAIVAAWANLRVPTVQVFHGYGDLTRPPSLKSWTRRRLERWAIRRMSCHIVVVSAAMKNAVANHLGYSTDKIHCVRNGIDLERFPFIERKPSVTPIICLLGTLAKAKGTDQAVHAFHLLQKKLPGARLRIVGEGPLRFKIETLIEELCLGGSIELLGQRPDIPSVLANGELFWQLSQSEGLPLAIIEAMGTGLPVIGTDVPGIREVVIDGLTGFLVSLENNEAVVERSIRLLSDVNLYNAFAKESRNRIEKDFSKQRMIAEHETILNKAIGKVA